MNKSNTLQAVPLLDNYCFKDPGINPMIQIFIFEKINSKAAAHHLHHNWCGQAHASIGVFTEVCETFFFVNQSFSKCPKVDLSFQF